MRALLDSEGSFNILEIPCRPGPFPWLALSYGMVSHLAVYGHFQEYSPRN